MYISQIY